MNSTVKAWIAKAEGDFDCAEALFRRRKKQCNDIICFHCQQCIEKYMKAVLIFNKIVPPKIHDLPSLDLALQKVDSTWFWAVEELRFLSKAAVSFRYPGKDADRKDARTAIAICRRLRDRLRGMIR
jgi:HEPN domain-containing protein